MQKYDWKCDLRQVCELSLCINPHSMLKTVLFLLLTLCPTYLAAQSIWQQIYHQPVRLYHAISADSVYIVDGFDIKLNAGGTGWQKVGSIPRLVDTSSPDGIAHRYYLISLFSFSTEKFILAVETRMEGPSGYVGDLF